MHLDLDQGLQQGLALPLGRMQLDKYAFGPNYTQKERTAAAAVVAHAHRVQAGRTDNIVTKSKIRTDQGQLTPIRSVDVRTTLSDTYTHADIVAI